VTLWGWGGRIQRIQRLREVIERLRGGAVAEAYGEGSKSKIAGERREMERRREVVEREEEANVEAEGARISKRELRRVLLSFPSSLLLALLVEKYKY
jgi:hypothetical protein